MLLLVLVVLLVVVMVGADKPAPIVFVIQSQPGDFHTALAEKSRKSILDQWSAHVPSHVMSPPSVLLSSLPGAWTLFPLVQEAAALMTSSPALEWAAILAENTKIDLVALNRAVEKYRFQPASEPLFLGRALRDSEATIVHHFARPREVAYPDTEAGIFLSRALVLQLQEQLASLDSLDEETKKLFPSDFSIDPSYEFARFVARGGRGAVLQDVEEICSGRRRDGCFTWSEQETSCLRGSQSGELRDVLDTALVAVKTCSRFHADRVPVVKATWGPSIPHLHFVSDVADPEIPTMVLPHTINTESGHCNKSLAILAHFLQQPAARRLLVIVDDDTILSAARLAAMLACYTEEEGPFLLGQRYGYMAATGLGYSYITGGGGIVINRPAAARLLGCPCPAPSTPDDMHLGMCAARGGLPLIHSGRMFQARPPDYPAALTRHRRPVSFHKHWEIDPVAVYREHFQRADARLAGREEL